LRLDTTAHLGIADDALLVAKFAGRSAEKLDGVDASTVSNGEDGLLFLPGGIASGESCRENDQTGKPRY
jgi:hypothetical protein